MTNRKRRLISELELAVFFFDVTWASRHAGHQGEAARFKRSKFSGHTRTTLFLRRSSIFEQVAR
jgi:hypothetical protein